MISAQCSLGLSDDELSRWRDDDLNPARMALIREHTVACAACRERLAAFGAISVGLRGLEPPPLDLARLLANLRDTTSSAAATATYTPLRLPTSAPRRSRRLVTGAAGLVAVLVISLLAGWIFAMHGRPHPATGVTPTPGQTLPAPIVSMPLTAIDMSPTGDGWAIGSPDSDRNGATVVLRHTGGQWVLEQTPIRGAINSIKTFSPTDAWAVGDQIYHYDGQTWREVRLPGKSALSQYGPIAAVSPSALWIAMNGSLTPTVLHFDGHIWAWQALPTMGIGSYTVTSISMVSADKGWAVVSIDQIPGATNGGFASMVLHYSGGVWRLFRAFPQYELRLISMGTATDGWMSGYYIPPSSTTSGAYGQLRLWRYSGGAWQEAPVPYPEDAPAPDDASIWNIHMFTATEGWMYAQLTPNEFQDPLFQFKNGVWNPIDSPGITQHVGLLRTVSFVSPTELWAISDSSILHYQDGIWTVDPA
jgi:hypothetical protein